MLLVGVLGTSYRRTDLQPESKAENDTSTIILYAVQTSKASTDM